MSTAAEVSREIAQGPLRSIKEQNNSQDYEDESQTNQANPDLLIVFKDHDDSSFRMFDPPAESKFVGMWWDSNERNRINRLL